MPPRNRTRRRTAAAAITLVFVLVAVASSAATRDRQPPRIVSAVVEDSNGDARADRLRLTYSEPIRHRKDTDGRYPFSVTGLRIASVGAASGKVLVLSLLEGGATTGTPAVRYVRTQSQPVEDRAGNQAPVQAFTTVEEHIATPPPPPPPPPGISDKDGDGVADAQDCGPNDPAIKPGAADLPDLALVDSNCDGIDGTEKKAIFVSPLGKDTNGGTKAAPMRSIQAAVVEAAQDGKDVYAAAGAYDRFDAADNVGVYGGYRPDTWARSLALVTSITGAPDGILAAHTTGVVLQHLTVRGEAPNQPGASAYGIRLVGGSKVTLQRVLVSAGSGIAGAGPAFIAANGVAGGPGGVGSLGEGRAPRGGSAAAAATAARATTSAPPARPARSARQAAPAARARARR
jgi:hypothetical protein